MTPDRVKELLPILQAYSEGKCIQYSSGINTEWKNIGKTWDFETGFVVYRIKTEEGIQKQLEESCLRFARYNTLDEWIEIYNKANLFKKLKILSHADILRMWWKMKSDRDEWGRVMGYSIYDKSYLIIIPRYGKYLVLKDELLRDWEYAEEPQE
jgi:hypothetical protein